MPVKAVTGAANAQTLIKEDFPLDRLVKGLSVFAVAGLASFLTAVQDFFKGHRSASISCAPLVSLNSSLPYDETKAEYDRTYCLEHLVDYTSVIPKNLSFLTSEVPFHAHIHGRVMYQRYFPYVLGVQAAFCAGPVIFWNLYGAEFLNFAVKYVGDKINTTPSNLDAGIAGMTTLVAGSNKPDVKTPSVAPELTKQITKWWNQTSLTKRYIVKLAIHEITFIIVLYFYFGQFDGFFIKNIKHSFICYVDKKELVKCNFAGVGLLKMVWYINIALIVLALLINTLQLIKILCCRGKVKQGFLHSWHSIAAVNAPDKCCNNFLNDAQMIAAICRENISKLPSNVIDIFELPSNVTEKK